MKLNRMRFWISRTASPLAQGRGLKRSSAFSSFKCGESPLAQGRGLKLGFLYDIELHSGRPSRRGVD